MDRLNQLRGEAGGSRDSTLDTSSPPSEAFMTANESTSKYFSMSEVESAFDISPLKDVSLASTAVDTDRTATDPEQLISNLSPINKKNDLLDSYKIGKQIEAANILSGGVDIFDDNDNSYDGNELIIDDNVEIDNKSNSELKIIESAQVKGDVDNAGENVAALVVSTASNKCQAMLRIGDKIIEAIDIGNGLYMYRQDGQEELEAVQFSGNEVKFLKVRENGEGNLEIYEEIQVEVPKEVPIKEGKNADKNVSHVAVKDKVKSDTTDNQVKENKNKTVENKSAVSSSAGLEPNKDTQSETKDEASVNGKMKFNEARKSPVIGSFTPMTYHSTPNKEGIPLTKTMVDLQLHPSRHSDNIKKTIEAHTDSSKQKSGDSLNKTIKNINNEKQTPDVNIKCVEKTIQGNNKNTKIPETNVKDGEVLVTKKCEQMAEKEIKKTIVEKQCVKENKVVFSGEIAEKSDKSLEKVGELPIIDRPSQNILKIAKDNDTLNSDTHSQKKSEGNKDGAIQTITTTSVENSTSSDIQNKDENTIAPNVQNKANERNDKSLDVKLSVPNNENKTEKMLVDQSDQPSTSNVSFDKDTLTSTTETTKNITSQSQHQNTAEHETEEVNLESKIVPEPSREVLPLDVSSKSFTPENNVTKVTAVPKLLEQNSKDNIINPKSTDRKPHENINIKETENRITIVKEPIKSLPSKDEIKEGSCTDNIDKKSDTKHIEVGKNPVSEKIILDQRDNVKPSMTSLPKPINNNHSAVPFGKWTEANRQEFLNKIKESKVPTAISNGKQIKNSNDLNRRDVLKKIDSQRQTTAKALEIANSGKLNVKKETSIFTNKSSVSSESQNVVKADSSLKNKPPINKKPIKEECSQKPTLEAPTISTTMGNVTKKEASQRKEINNQDLIDKTIEDLINRSVPVKNNQEDTSHNALKESKENPKTNPQDIKQLQSKTEPSSLDEIEMQMNKLHGIPFVERPPHELPQVSSKHSFKTYSKAETEKTDANRLNKVPNLLPFVNKNQQKIVKENIGDVDSDEEIIEHEPITGDIDLDNKSVPIKPSCEQKKFTKDVVPQSVDASKKDAIITENDFDKFARRNSITYENCLKLNYEGSEKHNVIQTVVEKDNVKPINKDDILQVNIKSSQKQEICILPTKVQITAKLKTVSEEAHNKNYHHSSKVKMAYQSVMTAKRQLERPITIIEDKPVKVLYVDSNMDYYPSNLNVQGNDLVPIKKPIPDVEAVAVSSCDSLDSDVIDSTEENKLQDEAKTKSKHQRKQVLTPVDTPELELIEPEDLGFNVSPKKKRKTEEHKIEKNTKALVPKKSYLLGRSSTTDDKIEKSYDMSGNSFKETIHSQDSIPIHNDAAASAIDSLVKAAALIETQSENIIKDVANAKISDTSPVPIKRGRGRPRKYPLPEGDTDKIVVPSPQKKPRLIDAKVKKIDNDIEEDDSSSDEIVTENWTMGKINENIVCPICGKLFRSENVVFKHVKHCTGPSPNRSDSDKRSPRRGRQSQESDTMGSKYKEPDVEDINEEKTIPKKRKSKENPTKSSVARDDVIVIDDTPVKEKPEKRDPKSNELKKVIKNKAPDKLNNLVCEFCGKIFRQLSYLVNHKLQHAKEDTKKNENDIQSARKSVFGCEVCKKEFRKLHHLVQHRIIHNPSSMSARLLRKSSSEQRDNKPEKDQTSKQNDDSSAGFRCEPCDKSFRKLHHLVEHRETHDGINRQKNPSTTQINIEKSLPKVIPPPQCDVCKKSFRKLHHLIEHKEQHLETSSEKSDDKSVKSSLSTKDIIHECSLCYMVFPNEHSLTKHATICQRKKRQSITKALKPLEIEETEENVDIIKQDETKKLDENIEVELEKVEMINNTKPESTPDVIPPNVEVVNVGEERSQTPQLLKKTDPIASEKEPIVANIEPELKQVLDKNVFKILEDSSKAKEIRQKKVDEKEIVNIHKTPKKKIPKEKIASTVTKRQKTVDKPLPVVNEGESKPIIESSDDDDVRYMLNPDFKVDTSSEGKLFMKVRAKKRNSLQIERPNSKDLVKRRISLQHPPKIPRLKPKSVESKILPINRSTSKNASKTPTRDPVLTDSDDNDIKYSFPKTIAVKTPKSVPQEALSKDEKKTQRKSLIEKRKSLSGIAKRKSLGKVIAKHKVKSSPMKPIKKRTAEAEHRCDCGQLFSSAALLARHTTLAHTPPRIRRRRSPPPEIDSKTITKPASRKSSATGKSRPSADSRKSSVKSDAGNSNLKLAKETRKSSVNKSDAKASNDTRKSLKSGEESVNKSASSTKPRRNPVHRGVPVPQKIRKVAEKNKK